jgi:hypothetical protein
VVEAPPVEPPPVVEPPLLEPPPSETPVAAVEEVSAPLPAEETVPAEVAETLDPAAVPDLVPALVSAPEALCDLVTAVTTAAYMPSSTVAPSPAAAEEAPETVVGVAPTSRAPVRAPLNSSAPMAPTGVPVPPTVPAPGGGGTSANASVGQGGSGSGHGDHDSLAAVLAAGLPASLATSGTVATSGPAGSLAHGMDDTGDRPD